MSHVTTAGEQEGAGADNAPIAAFGLFELDLRAGELWRGGVRVPLQEQPLRVLVFLLRHAGGIVTREELREHLWPTAFVDFDHGLNAAIRKLRAALDDSAETPRYVETVARRGYRFIAPVAWRQPGIPAAARPHRYSWPVAIGVTLAVLLTFAASLIPRRGAPSARIESIAVLPFTTDTPANGHISDGLTEGLIDSLSRVSGVRVLSSAAVFAYGNRSVDFSTAGKELGVQALVTGAIRRHGDGFVVRAELLRTRDGSQMWGDRFTIPDSELMEVQSRIAGELKRRLGASLPHKEGTRNPDAYEAYLKGLYAWNRRKAPHIRQSIEYFRKATELDPTFAAPYSGLAQAWGVMVGNGWVSPEEGVPKILAAVDRALELDPDDAAAYASRATTKFRNQWDFAGAEEDYRHAIALRPNYATAHQWYADYLRAMGRPADARREIEIAYRLDPLSTPITAARCWSFLYERRYEEALAFARRARELDESFDVPFCTASVLTILGRHEEMLAELEKIQKREGQAKAFAAAYREFGIVGLHRARLKELTASDRAEYAFPVEIAMTYTLLGNEDEAFAWLEKAYRHRVSQLTSFHIHPAFEPIRDDPRFADLGRRIGLPQFAR